MMLKNGYMGKIIAILLLRLLTPLIIFINPPVAMILSLIFDEVDGPLCYKAGLNWKTYNILDKILDYWWYMFILLFSFHTTIFNIILALFIYRTFGQLISIVFRTEKYFIYFPNILERLFNIYIILNLFGLNYLFNNPPILLWVFIISSVIALYIEWSTHIEKKSHIAKIIFKTEIDWSKNEK